MKNALFIVLTIIGSALFLFGSFHLLFAISIMYEGMDNVHAKGYRDASLVIGLGVYLIAIPMLIFSIRYFRNKRKLRSQ